MTADEDDDWLRRLIAKLPEQDREIVELRYIHGFGHRQIAERLDLPLGTVLARGHRGIKLLNQWIEEGGNSSQELGSSDPNSP